ncbi:MAG: hypothetical protein OXH09_06930, partial [Gammaproteobacteria bacterium]|nr:hypothetical protein [Gammaproteobacteria bacterium]
MSQSVPLGGPYPADRIPRHGLRRSVAVALLAILVACASTEPGVRKGEPPPAADADADARVSRLRQLAAQGDPSAQYALG